MVMSGLVAKIPDKAVASGIRDTYQKMDNLRKRLNNVSKFFAMLLSTQPGVPRTFIIEQLNTKVQASIDAVELDMKIFNESAENTVTQINKVFKLYGQEIKIEILKK